MIFAFDIKSLLAMMPGHNHDQVIEPNALQPLPSMHGRDTGANNRTNW